MFKFFFSLLFILICVLGYVWFSAFSLPGWYQEQNRTSSSESINNLSKSIQNEGIERFFRTKINSLLSGKVTLNQDEFNALLYASLMSNQKARRLIAASKDLRAQLHEDKLEVGAVFNTQKLGQLKPKLRNQIKQVTNKFTFLKDKDVYVAVIGQPIAIQGRLALDKDISIKIGDLVIPSSLLSILGIDINGQQAGSLKLKYLKLNDLDIKNKYVELTVRPSL